MLAAVSNVKNNSYDTVDTVVIAPTTTPTTTSTKTTTTATTSGPKLTASTRASLEDLGVDTSDITTEAMGKATLKVALAYVENGGTIVSAKKAIVPSTTQEAVTQTPATQAPAPQLPVIQTPATQAPTTQTPAIQAPVTQTPVTQAPATSAVATPSNAKTITPEASTAKVTKETKSLSSVEQLIKSSAKALANKVAVTITESDDISESFTKLSNRILKMMSSGSKVQMAKANRYMSQLMDISNLYDQVKGNKLAEANTAKIDGSMTGLANYNKAAVAIGG